MTLGNVVTKMSFHFSFIIPVLHHPH
eukprot:COSAG05_NODE_23694_length_256_cov_0.656051_1_plen_25_part_10